MAIKHAFINQNEDGTDDSITRPSDWNDEHVVNLAIVETSNDYTLTAANEMVVVDASGGTKYVTFPDAATLVLESEALGGKIFDVAKAVGDTTLNKIIGRSATNDLFNGCETFEITFRGTNLTWVTTGGDWILR
jgi:hypothetical protein